MVSMSTRSDTSSYPASSPPPSPPSSSPVVASVPELSVVVSDFVEGVLEIGAFLSMPWKPRTATDSQVHLSDLVSAINKVAEVIVVINLVRLISFLPHNTFPESLESSITILRLVS
ncbi:putative ectopic P granules protein 5-like protein isoform X1 [Sesbania bispinosa]|nr:putative ectopic P granules protein 5-like protein isoform X1 [Sesbania bispinosa]